MTRRFGMRLDGWMAPSSCINLAVAAEECGFDSIWFAENPFGRGVLPAMAGCGIATKKIEIGAGVFNPFNRHPSLIAMEMGALDELLSGRANLGIGSGIAYKLAEAHIGSEKPIAAMRDTIVIIRELMKGNVVNYDGKVFSAHGLSLEFSALRPDYPIFMASMGEQSIRLAGQLADGIMISNLCTPGFTRRALELIASDEKPRVPSGSLTVVQYAPCVARPDRVDARNFAKGVVGKMIQGAFGDRSTPKSREWHVLGSGLPEEEFIEMAKRLEAGAKGSDVLSDQVLDLFAVAGNADDCLAAYQRYLDVGVSEMVVTFRGSEPVSEMKYLADALRTLR
jgi:5,10-methylenetetrahydromethanopterin reductase